MSKPEKTTVERKRPPPVKVLSGQLRSADSGDGCVIKLGKGRSLMVSLVWMQGTVLDVQPGRDTVLLVDDAGTFAVQGVNNIPKGKPCLSQGKWSTHWSWVIREKKKSYSEQKTEALRSKWFILLFQYNGTFYIEIVVLKQPIPGPKIPPHPQSAKPFLLLQWRSVLNVHIRAATNGYFHYQLIWRPLSWLINCKIYKTRESNEKCPFQCLRVQSQVFTCLVVLHL